MPGFKIISDSSCDLPDDLLRQYDISLVHYYVTIDGGQHYQKEFVDIHPTEFYHILRTQNVYPKTSLPPIQDYIDAFRPVLEAGQDILCICLTSKFSGSFQSAYNAYNILMDEFPDRTIQIYDSRECTLGQGVVVVEAAKLRDKGYPMGEITKILDKMVEGSNIVFTVDSLDYLQRGGRIGRVTAFAGSLLNIKPIIYMENGELLPIAKVRGRNRALREVVDLAMKGIGSKPEDYIIITIHSDCLPELQKVEADLLSRGPIQIEYQSYVIGTTIGTHIGPTVVGIGYFPRPETL